MKYIQFNIFLLLPILLFSQSNIDITGRISMRIQNIEYDQESEIKPDSINSDEYSKSAIIPGLQQTLNLSLFGRTQDFEFTLLSDLKNNDWNKLDFADFNSFQRLSLHVKIVDHEIIMGDFYQSDNERYLQSREIRGFKYSTAFQNILGKNTFINLVGMGGQTQRAIEVGDRLQNTYKQFESSGLYSRYLGATHLSFGKSGLFDMSLKYLQGEDKKSSINESVNPALKNSLIGIVSNFFVFEKGVRLFADYYSSTKDTVDEGSIDDYSFKSGIDLYIDKIKFLLYYQYIGYDYYSMGYPFLENDKNGFKALLGYNFSDWLILNTDYEQYDNNLNNNEYKPKTNTKIINTGLITIIKNYPELTFNYGLRSDIGNKVFNADSLELSSDKKTQKFDIKIAHKIDKSRLSLSASFIKLDDKSLVGGIISSDSNMVSPLGTDQFVCSFNFYTQPSQYLYFSGGIVYNSLQLTNNQKNKNFYIYESNRWDVIPRKLKIETNITALFNDSQNGGVQDYLSDYFQLIAELSFEYFFTYNMSLKLTTGTNSRKFKYTTREAEQIIIDPDYGPNFFNGNESYSSWLIGGEFNWNF